MSKPYTLDELLTIVVAREIHDYENVVLGVGVPMTAGALAKALFAPHATLMMESGIVDFRPLLSLNNIADAHSCRGFSYATDLFSAFTMTYGVLSMSAFSGWVRLINTAISTPPSSEIMRSQICDCRDPAAQPISFPIPKGPFSPCGEEPL